MGKFEVNGLNGLSFFFHFLKICMNLRFFLFSRLTMLKYVFFGTKIHIYRFEGVENDVIIRFRDKVSTRSPGIPSIKINFN
jgi:hypothetical protein